MSNNDVIKIETKKDKIPQRSIMKKGLIPSHPTVSIFNGGIGSGKTMLLLNLLSRDCYYGKKNYKGKQVPCYFDEIYVFSPTVMDDDLYDEIEIPENNKFPHPNTDDLRKIIDKQKKLLEKKEIHEIPRILFIFDDIQTQRKFIGSKEFRECIFAGRHISSSSWIVGQSFTRTPRDVRQQASHIFYFQGNESENNIIADEFGIMGLSRKEMDAIIQYATEEKYSFLHINKKAPERAERFRKKITGLLRIKPKSERMMIKRN